MKSMTGYGRGECARDGFKVTVELSSVNRKQSEISVALPRELEVLEAQIRDAINRSIARGRLTARITRHAADSRTSAQVRARPPHRPAGQGLRPRTQPPRQRAQARRRRDAGCARARAGSF